MHIAFRAALLGAVVLLSACGGGGGGTASSAGTQVTGVVAVGAPLAGAGVESWCADGKPGASTRTSAGGTYDMTMPADCPTPWVLKATSADRPDLQLYSLADLPPGKAANINITTLTNLLVQLTISREDFRGIVEQILAMTPQDRTSAFQDVVGWLNGVSMPGMQALTLKGIVYEPFTPQVGNPMDDWLEYFAQQAGNLTNPDLAEQIGKKGGDLAGANPWKTLFTGNAPLVLSGTDCTSSGGAVADATATLRMDGANLRVDMASDALGGPLTLTVGPAVRSDFTLEVRGDSPFARIWAYQSGAGLFRVDNTGTPTFLMTNGGTTSVSCTLANPVRRDALVAFHPAARVLSAVPKTGASGSCPGFSYAVTALGDVGVDGSSLPDDWLDASHARYYENLQFLLFGSSTPAYQVELVARADGAGIQPYFFSPSYGLNCLP